MSVVEIRSIVKNRYGIEKVSMPSFQAGAARDNVTWR